MLARQKDNTSAETMLHKAELELQLHADDETEEERLEREQRASA